MPSYQPYLSATSLLSACEECFALVEDKNRYSHDQWHIDLKAQRGQGGYTQGTTSTAGTPIHTHEFLIPANLLPAVGDAETEAEMLRRLLREVMELSERME